MAQGVFMGGEANVGEGSSDQRSIAATIAEMLEKFSKGMGIRKIVGQIGDIFSLIAPGVGHGLSWGADRLTEHLTDIGDPSEIGDKETMWTGTGYEDEFEKMQKEATPGLLESIADKGLSFLASEYGEEFLSEKMKGIKEAKLTKEGWIPSKSMMDVPKENKLNIGKDYKGKISKPSTWFQFEEGGYIPKYENGGTISDYFDMQGKTLGGSNKQSISEMLGRK